MSKPDVHRGSPNKSKFVGKGFSPSERHNSLNPVIKNPLNTEITEKRNSQYLEKLGRRAKGEATPKVGKILELYNLRKISYFE